MLFPSAFEVLTQLTLPPLTWPQLTLPPLTLPQLT
jgi:hypothetical protein